MPDIHKKPEPESAPQPKNLFQKIHYYFGVSNEEIKHLFANNPDPEKRSRFIVFMIGVLLTPITLGGALLGYVRGYKRFMRYYNELPNFHPMRRVILFAMIVGAIGIWLAFIILFIFVIYPLILMEMTPTKAAIIAYIVFNVTFTGIVYGAFAIWRKGVNNALVQGEKFGTARFAYSGELAPYATPKGIYIGGGLFYAKQGHILTMAGSRSGKFTNLIAPNLLGWGDIDGSWVVIDPKGEIAAVTSQYQRSIGQNIVVLNPWGLLTEHIGDAQSYNPLDILDPASIHFVDDCTMLAEMLVPVETGRNKFFSDSARAVITGLILQIAVSQTGDDRTLKTLWKWVRYPQGEWDRVVAEMENSDDELNGENLLYAAGEINKITAAGGNAWGSILATILQATEFLKSPSLQRSLQSGFDPKTLAHNNTTLYIIIPADKLQSHSRWLRLVTTSTMRAVIRKPNKRVCFILDEFAALGYLPEIETALGAYAGFNVTVWPILQSLVQLNNLYEKNWEVFIGNSAVRQYFGIQNNFDAKYISEAMGKKSHVLVTRSWFGVKDAEASPRDLITPDELRIASGDNIFTFIGDEMPTYFAKRPYYEVEYLKDNAGENPYF